MLARLCTYKKKDSVYMARKIWVSMLQRKEEETRERKILQLYTHALSVCKWVFRSSKTQVVAGI